MKVLVHARSTPAPTDLDAAIFRFERVLGPIGLARRRHANLMTWAAIVYSVLSLYLPHAVHFFLAALLFAMLAGVVSATKTERGHRLSRWTFLLALIVGAVVDYISPPLRAFAPLFASIIFWSAVMNETRIFAATADSAQAIEPGRRLPGLSPYRARKKKRRTNERAIAAHVALLEAQKQARGRAAGTAVVLTIVSLLLPEISRPQAAFAGALASLCVALGMLSAFGRHHSGLILAQRSVIRRTASLCVFASGLWSYWASGRTSELPIILLGIAPVALRLSALSAELVLFWNRHAQLFATSNAQTVRVVFDSDAPAFLIRVADRLASNARGLPDQVEYSKQPPRGSESAQ